MCLEKIEKMMEAVLVTLEEICKNLKRARREIDETNAKLDLEASTLKQAIKCNLKCEAAKSCISVLETTSMEPTKPSSHIFKLNVTGLSANIKEPIEREERTKRFVDITTIEMKANDYYLENKRGAG